jgi:hypothetical protein
VRVENTDEIRAWVLDLVQQIQTVRRDLLDAKGARIEQPPDDAYKSYDEKQRAQHSETCWL